jgi:hypothetical protein
MLPYWIFFSIPALPVLFVLGRRLHLTWLFWLLLWLLFSLIIGLRHEVGGDWFNYVANFERYADASLGDSLAKGDPAYEFLNWAAASLGLDIYAVNLVCAAFFVAGLIMFCRQQTNPLLAFTLAIPYLVTVVAMGYSRQGVALGLLFWAISYLEQNRMWPYMVLIAVGALFHKTVLVMIPFAVFLVGDSGRKWMILRIGAVALGGYGLWDALLAEEQDQLWENYVEAQMVSEGAMIRALMNVVPSILLLAYWRRWKESFSNHWFWFWMAVASLFAVGMVDFASTAVDRIALYLSPIQMAVYTRLPYLPLLPHRQLDPNMVTVAILIAYAAVLYVWLNYATHAQYWIPYQNILL